MYNDMTLTRTGFVIDHIHYYADALKPWIARRGEFNENPRLFGSPLRIN